MTLKAYTLLIFVSCCLFFSSCSKEKQTASIRFIQSKVNHRINDIYFIDANIGIAVGGDKFQDGYILRTDDGGKTWQKLEDSNIISSSEVNLQTLNSIDFLNKDIGQIVGHGGKILRTEDGGKNWSLILHGSWDSFTDIAMIDTQKTILVSAIAFSAGNQYITPDKWYYLDRSEYEFALRDIHFTSATTGYIVGLGHVLKTTDEGQTWSILKLSRDYFFNISFPSENTGYICGWDGGIYKTTDAGENWQTLKENNKVFTSRQHYENIDFINENKGVVCGYRGEILYTQDGGSTWKTIETNTNEDFHSISFLNEKTIFAGAENGVFIEITLD